MRGPPVKRHNVVGRLDLWTIRRGDSDLPSLADRGQRRRSASVAAFTLSASAEEVAEGRSVVVTIAADGVTFTLAGTATPGDDFTLAAHGEELSDPYTATLPAGATSVAVTIETVGDGEDDVGETIALSASHDGTAIGTVTITIAAPPPAPRPVIFGGGGGGGPSGPTPSAADFAWTVTHDIDELDSGNDTPTGMWSDGTTLWLLDNPDGAGDAVYAYALASGERAEDREFQLDARNRAPRGLWADGTTLWVSDSGQDELFAYALATGERLADRDIALDERNAAARGLWAGGETLWVLDGGKDTLFAYELESGVLLAAYTLDDANGDPRGLWSDGVTLWVADPSASPRRLFAYRLPALPAEDVAAPEEPPALERVRTEEFDQLNQASNNSPRGLWADGAVMYVVDANDDKVYSYNAPDAIDARLASLTLSGVDFGAFSPLRTAYASATIPPGNIATLTATPAQEGATVQIEPPDHDGDPATGRQVRLLPGLAITITVTAPDGSRLRVYRLRLGEQAPQPHHPGPAGGWRLGGRAGRGRHDRSRSLRRDGRDGRLAVHPGHAGLGPRLPACLGPGRLPHRRRRRALGGDAGGPDAARGGVPAPGRPRSCLDRAGSAGRRRPGGCAGGAAHDGGPSLRGHRRRQRLAVHPRYPGLGPGLPARLGAGRLPHRPRGRALGGDAPRPDGRGLSPSLPVPLSGPPPALPHPPPPENQDLTAAASRASMDRPWTPLLPATCSSLPSSTLTSPAVPSRASRPARSPPTVRR